MKFQAGDHTDTDLVRGIQHEFLRCDDAFSSFRVTAGSVIVNGHTPEWSYAAYNSYSQFVFHLYEFMMGRFARDVGDTAVATSKGPCGQPASAMCDYYITRHANRILKQTREAIENGTAPAWENALSGYPVEVPDGFAATFRRVRNKAIGHVSPIRATLDLTAFYTAHHLMLVLLWRDARAWWRLNGKPMPDLDQVTAFMSAVVAREPAPIDICKPDPTSTP